jgi:hypothetical protein
LVSQERETIQIREWLVNEYSSCGLIKKLNADNKAKKKALAAHGLPLHASAH